LNGLGAAQVIALLQSGDFGLAAQPSAVEGANQPPVLANPLADQEASEDAAFSFVLPADTFSDPGDRLAYATGELPSWLSFDSETGTFSGTPSQADVGSVEVRVTVTDEAGLTAEDGFVLVVVNTNDAPVAAQPIADQSASEDAAFSFTVPQEAFSDEDAGEVLEWFARGADGSALPGWLSFDALERRFSGTPGDANVGTLEVRVGVNDESGAQASSTFTLTVSGVNDAPAVEIPLADRSFEAGSAFAFAVPAGTFGDPDAGDSLAFAASLSDGSALRSWIAFDPATAMFSGTAGDALGAWSLRVIATDTAGEAASSDFAFIVRAVAGSSASGGSGNDVMHGGSGDETLIAKGGSDYVFGDAGDDLLRGGNGNDVLQGGEGDDVLRSGNGQNLLEGGAGDDVIHGGQGAGFLAGGAGNDTIRVGRGNDVIAFNAGDGIDTLIGGRDGGNTLSLGGGIGYSDLSFSKSGHDLVVNAGADDKLVLKNWYRGNHSVLNLQIVADAMEEFDATSSDPLYSRKVQVFDMWALVAKFDQAIAANPHLDSWSLMNGLSDAHLSASDDAALGGDLAYWYGKNRTLAGISISAAQDLLGTPGFGSDAQSLRPFTGLQEGFIKLA
jgi:Ca2+-binding RTX toxin-like protein